MTSKVQIQKDKQGYTAAPRQCGNCIHFTSDAVSVEGMWGTYTVVKNKRCGIGNFAVKVTAVCNLYSPRRV